MPSGNVFRPRISSAKATFGAPKGNRNALKDGFYTENAIEERRALRIFLREAEAQIARLA